ncbi:MAG: hypothetical protein CVV64_10285 [Candidatus Wallbacteria bacterium HGW-Wallbacteria-1]|jgi:TolB protein|uniref:Dipeptidylpeptidase IV N-terminal domain-containing protein n=1 Tax=Candidatus Wallbacteria bacterium HGW-Wallbacteria-1 TaxID=2013854 RepID=A0A2N1PPS6_9BACT|nr:MAG: hypothetical protein CVV64_10285 [Candidatus Wallbacteria bacterium HGW-Wallbacteria-1]
MKASLLISQILIQLILSLVWCHLTADLFSTCSAADQSEKGQTSLISSPPWEKGGEKFILFSSSRKGSHDLWTCNVDGTELTRLTLARDDERSPSARPGHGEIAYIGGQRVPMLMSLKWNSGKAVPDQGQAIPFPDGIYGQPAWSFDGNWLAVVRFSVIPGDQSEIWMIRRQNGWGEPKRVTTCPPMRLNPAFSPNNLELACASFRRDNIMGVIEEISLIKLESSSQAISVKNLTSINQDTFDPAWAPDGNLISFTSNESGNYDVFILNLSSGEKRAITQFDGYDGESSWSEDGSQIAFISSRSGKREIWIHNLLNNTDRQITSSEGNCSDPDWFRATGRE